MGNYENLRFLHRARVLAVRVHHLVSRLPPAERRRRGDQLIRAANSIRNNIVEGSTGTVPQFARFLAHAIASADEVQEQLLDLADVGLLAVKDADLLGEPSEIAAMITAFRKKILRSNEGK